jgi:hypothetical protein
MHRDGHLDAARALLAEPTGNLRYAALELRFAIESIVYEKLRLYAARVPAAVLDKWQPPQAMRALVQFEPNAAREKVIRLGRQPALGAPPTEWFTLGEHRTFTIQWLNKSYNQLGSFLHEPAPSRERSTQDTGNETKMRVALESILTEVERVAGSTIDGTLASVVTFQCMVCDRPTICNEAAARETRRAVCLDPACAAEHNVAVADDGTFTFFLNATDFDCLSCKALTPVQNRHLAIGRTFKCASCGVSHTFVETHWGYALSSELTPPGA